MSTAGKEPIALVGIGCRFAGASDLHAYWALGVDGGDAFGPIPRDRWDHAAFFSESARAVDKSYAPRGGFLSDVRTFPAVALQVPPRRVEVMDPQQRLALEMALQAVDDGGLTPGALPRRTGVYMGVTAVEYRTLSAARITAQLMASGDLGEPPADPDVLAAAVERVVPVRPFSAPGVLANMIAATVSQELRLTGPAFTTDAACASSLVAVAQAVDALRSGAIDAALAGGVYLCLTPEHHIAFSRIGAMSKSGFCRPFDARADGFVQGDGCGVVLLQRLSDARAAGRRVYAVLHGVGVNNDGGGDGPMAPVQSGQADCIRLAWRDAGIDPARLGYLETHGTGTAVGDQIELAGVRETLGDRAEDVVLGSSKANVGHTMSAAGVAGLIRAAMTVHLGVRPPMAGFEAPKPELGLAGSPFRIPTVAEAWPAADRIAAVSSFGFGGTNVHAVLAAPADLPAAPPEQAELILMSAATADALRDLCGRTARALEADAGATVAGVARAWAVRRRQAARVGLVARTRDELIARLGAFAAGEVPNGVFPGTAAETPPRVAFLFPGQGAQRVGMLRDIAGRFPMAADALDAVDEALADLGLLAHPVTALLYPERRDTPTAPADAERALTDTRHTQPVLFAVGAALTRILEAAGVRPHVVAGHSVGEFTAAAAAGLMSVAEGARFTARRGAAMAAVTGDRGAMVAVGAPAARVARLLPPGAVIANVNHPQQVVISGTTDAVAEAARRAEEAGLRPVPLQVSHGFHSPIFAGLDLTAAVADIAMTQAAVPVASCIADAPYATPEEARAVFLRHATSPVHFTEALAQCRDAGAELYVQVGAGGPLIGFARGTLPGVPVIPLASNDDQDGGASVLAGLAALWVRGVEVTLDAITAPAPPASVPPSVLPRETYWLLRDPGGRRVALAGATAVPAATATAAAPEREGPPARDRGVAEAVVGAVATASAYPRDALRPDMTLGDDLGFDSLMVVDLAEALRKAIPGLPAIPQEVLQSRPTIGDLIAFCEDPAAATPGAQADDDAPLDAFAPVWRDCPLPDGAPERPRPAGPVWVIGPEAVTVEAFAAALRAAGAGKVFASDLLATPTDRPVGALVWVGAATAPTVADVLAEDADWPDTAGSFLAAVDAQARAGARPDVLAVRLESDVWAEAVSGAVRAIAREWPDAACKAIVTDRLDGALGAAALAELRSADGSVDVRFRAGVRQIRGTERLPDLEPTLVPGPADTALVTGGTRGIGLAVAERLVAAGTRVLLVGRGAPDEAAEALIARSGGRVRALRADVSRPGSLAAALDGSREPITIVVHAAGVLADGALGAVSPEAGRATRAVKAGGWLEAIRAAGPSLRVILGVGSWAGRFGSRHQAHYSAANALLAALSKHAPGHARGVTSEMGPWVGSEMVASIPVAVQAAMRAEGVDFASPEAGLEALLGDLGARSGSVVHGRQVPATLRRVSWREELSLATHPYLADHAIDGTPVLPLAAAAEALARAAGLSAPFEIRDLTLYQGVAVRTPQTVDITVDGERGQVRSGDTLHYAARVRALDAPPADDPAPGMGDSTPAAPDLDTFYREVTFHGPRLRAVESIQTLGDGVVRGILRTGRPADWIPSDSRPRWELDPLALDGAFQLCAYAANALFGRAGTPVGFRRYVQLRPPEPGAPLQAEARFGPPDGDRFTATVRMWDAEGRPVARCDDVSGHLAARETTETEDAPPPVPAEWLDVADWPEYAALTGRMAAVEAAGLKNPYFDLHEGTARDTTVIDGREVLSFSSYNYLGLSGDPRIQADVAEAMARYGTSVSASRVASGERPFHRALERGLADAVGVDDAIVFPSGHATNVTVIGHLFGAKDLVLHDELIHDSCLQGIRLSGAARRSFRHDDPDHLRHQLRELRSHHQRTLILIEGAYSMDGDVPDLARFLALGERYGCLLMVDEAHSFGAIGRTGCGLAEHAGVDPRRVHITMGTLSKSMASMGGFIAGSAALVQYLRYTTPGFVFAAGMPPTLGQAALSALRLMLAEPWRVERLQYNAGFFCRALQERGLDTGPARGISPVVPVITGDSVQALRLSAHLLEQGVNVKPIIFPAVAEDAARLRFFLTALHTEDQLLSTAERVAATLRDIRSGAARETLRAT